jgi:hypothetical protein
MYRMSRELALVAGRPCDLPCRAESADPVITAEAPSRLGGSVVTFHPGRSHRMARPSGWADTLLFVRRRPHLLRGREAASAEPGDTVNIPAGYDALARSLAPDRLFAHLALSETGEQGQGATWGAHVSDAEYNEAASGG